MFTIFCCNHVIKRSQPKLEILGFAMWVLMGILVTLSVGTHEPRLFPLDTISMTKKSHLRKRVELEISESESDFSTKSISSTMSFSEESDEEFHTQNPNVDDWILVKYETKKTVKRFVGQVLQIFENKLKVKFARKIVDSKFEWPESENIDDIDEGQVKMVLKPPLINSKNDRVTSFGFKMGFGGIAIF